MDAKAPLEPYRSELSAVITRADGRVEDLGVISQKHRNPVLNALGNARIKLRRLGRWMTGRN